MARTGAFTSLTGSTNYVVVGKITHFERDEEDKYTTIHLEGGAAIIVSESVDYVRDVVADT